MRTPQSGDRFFVMDISHEGGTPRYISWSALRGRFLTDAALDVADPTTESTIGAASRQSVAESLAAIAEPQLVISNDPTAGYVLSMDSTNTDMVWRAEGTTPVQTHTRYFATGIDRTFVEADYTGGLTFMSDTFTVPTFTVNSYLAIAVPASNPITTITLLGNPTKI